jgi:YhcH/YjgK/YiaL family protein
MILDKIKNLHLYKGLTENLDKAFEYIDSTDLSSLEDGKYVIEGEDVFALVQSYTSKDDEECKLEAHKKYIDIQMVISGSELMGISTLDGQSPVSENIEKDLYFYDYKSTKIELSDGMFVVLFPDDLHMPGMKNMTNAEVKKVVIKVRV